MTLLTAAEIWRDFVTDGVPASGNNMPNKKDIRHWGQMIESVLEGNGLGYATLALLNADLAHDAHELAIVYADSTAANNGTYEKSGASGTGSWTRVGDLPGDVLEIAVTGGTGNAITGNAIETPQSPGGKLYVMTPTANNTGATTLDLNGGGAVAIKNALNSTLASGSLIAGNTVLMIWNTDHYQLVVGAAIDANPILADAVAARNDAQTAAASVSIMGPADRTALKAIDTTNTKLALLREAGRDGIFVWKTGNFSTHIAADTNEGIYVKATAIAASSGAWVREFDFVNYWSKWFGAVADYSTDNTTLISNMMVVANLQNTNATAGKQTGVNLEIEGGVKFASQNLQWLTGANWVFINLRYWGNSDTTPGQVSYGTNEHITLSVNSGYSNDGSGGWVGEEMFNAPLHPAVGVNIHKNIDNSAYRHSGPSQRIQPTDAASAKGSVAFIKNENRDVFRIAHEHYATVSAVNGTLFYVDTHKTSLTATNVGVAGGWGSSSVPIAGGVVRDITTGGRYVVTGLATSILTCDWLSGAAVPGNTLMHERAIFKGSISGTTLTVTSMLQGNGNIASGQTIVGMFSNSGITVSTTITGLGTGTGGVGTYTVNNSQTIGETEIVCGFLSVNSIQGGGVSNTDTVNIPLMFGLDGKMYTKDATLLRARTTLTNGAAAASGTLTNAPAAGNPTKWIPIDDNGTTRYIPAW